MGNTYNNMGLVYYAQGGYEQALAYYENALVIKIKALGEDHPNVATTYGNMGVVCRLQGTYEQALAYYEKALAIRLKALGDDHPSVADIYNNMGLVYKIKAPTNKPWPTSKRH